MRDQLARLALAIRTSALRQARTACMAVVRATTPDGRLVLRPLVSEEIEAAGEVVETPASDVSTRPMFPSSGTFAMTWGVEAGDPALLVHRTRSHAEVDQALAAGQTPEQVQTPEQKDRFAWGYAAALPCAPVVRPGATHPAGHPVIWMTQGHTLRIGAAASPFPLARADRVDAELQAVWGYIVLMNAALVSGVPSYAPPAPMPTPAPTGSSRVSTDG